MFGICLGKPEYFRVCQGSVQAPGKILQIADLLFVQRQSFLTVVCLNIQDLSDRFRNPSCPEYLLVQSLVHFLQHGIKRVSFPDREKLFNPDNSRNVHTLADLCCHRAPGGNHFAPRAFEPSFEQGVAGIYGDCSSKQPGQGFQVRIG